MVSRKADALPGRHSQSIANHPIGEEPPHGTLRADALPPIRAGGGFHRDVTRRDEMLAQHDAGGGPVSLNRRGEWYGPKARDLNEKFIESSIGGHIADSARKLYKGHFSQRARSGESTIYPRSSTWNPTGLTRMKILFVRTLRYLLARWGRLLLLWPDI